MSFFELGGRTLGLAITAALMALTIDSSAKAADVCEALWRARNAIFANKGYCFEGPDAQAVFGKGCFPPYGKLSPAEDGDVHTIKDIEKRQGCAATPIHTGGDISGSAQGAVRTVPKYVVQMTLSPAAKSKLAASGETIRVAASYYGNAVAKDEDEVALANETVDLPNGTLAVNLGGISIPESEILKTIEKRPMMLINVYTSRKVFENNLLDCGIYQGEAARAGQVEINCKLIGE